MKGIYKQNSFTELLWREQYPFILFSEKLMNITFLALRFTSLMFPGIVQYNLHIDKSSCRINYVGLMRIWFESSWEGRVLFQYIHCLPQASLQIQNRIWSFFSFYWQLVYLSASALGMKMPYFRIQVEALGRKAMRHAQMERHSASPVK